VAVLRGLLGIIDFVSSHKSGAGNRAVFFGCRISHVRASRKLPAFAVTNRHNSIAADGKHVSATAVHRVMNSTHYPRARGALLAITAVPLSGIVLGALTLGGCARRPIIVQAPSPTVVQTPATAVVQTPPASTQPTGRDVIFIKEAPPPPREETPPPPPASSSYTWVPGYWTVREGRQEWVPGRYENPPRAGATWVAPRWERRADGYVFIEGYWR
jgi:hypothetical protein